MGVTLQKSTTGKEISAMKVLWLQWGLCRKRGYPDTTEILAPENASIDGWLHSCADQIISRTQSHSPPAPGPQRENCPVHPVLPQKSNGAGGRRSGRLALPAADTLGELLSG